MRKNTLEGNCAFTHNGTFHADDVLAASLLRLLKPELKIVRGNVVPNNFPGIVFDIGCGRYDHHQADAKVRPSGIKYAAFGLLWNDFGESFMDATHADAFDAAFVSEIDRCDNTSDTNLLSSLIAAFNPVWNENEDSDEQFEEAVSAMMPVLKCLLETYQKTTFVPRYCLDLDESICHALQLLDKEKRKEERKIPKFISSSDYWKQYGIGFLPYEAMLQFEKTFLNQVNRVYGKFHTSPFLMAVYFMPEEERVIFLKKVIERKMKQLAVAEDAKAEAEAVYNCSINKDLIFFPCYLPYETMTERHEEVKAVAFPSDRGGINIITANMNENEKKKNGIHVKTKSKRIEFPERMRGMEESKLRKEQKGLFFVHPSGYMAACDTLEDVEELFAQLFR